MPFKTFITITVVALLAACGGPKHIAPADVTPQEIAFRDECVKLLQERMPVGTALTDTELARDPIGEWTTDVRVNMKTKSLDRSDDWAGGFCSGTDEVVMLYVENQTVATIYRPTSNKRWVVSK